MAFNAYDLGTRTGTVADGSVVEGGTGSPNEASGVNSHAEGLTTVASGDSAHAEGQETIASAPVSHAEGLHTLASGNAAHAEGNGGITSSIIASGSGSHAEGKTIGSGTITASNDGSHAEGFAANGYAILSSNDGSHAEGAANGGNITASGVGSHAEGINTTASNIASHAEGSATTASGLSAHSEGDSTIASAPQSHAGGSKSAATHPCEWTRGSFQSGASGNFQYGIISFADVTSLAALQEIFISAGTLDRFAVAVDDSYACRMFAIGREAFSGDTGFFVQDFSVKNIAGVITVPGGPFVVAADANADPALAGAVITLSADNVNIGLKVEVTPTTATITNWQVRFDYVKTNRP